MGATLLEDDVEELLSMGAGYVLAIKIQGIPVGFAEALPPRFDSNDTAATPADLRAMCAALLFDEAASISLEIDRDTGFARGDALEFTLSWRALEADGLLPQLFCTPSKRARLTADLAAGATSADVDTTAGWAPGDLGYIGRELVQISAVTDADTFAITRDTQAYAYRASSPTTFGVIADKPVVWHNRDVEIHLHVLSPEGRILDNTWFASGGMHRVLWTGCLDGQPRESALGMRFRALPEVRRAATKLGYELGVEVVVPTVEDAWTFGDLPVVETPEAMVTFEGEFTGPSSGSFRITVQTTTTEVVTTLRGWCDRLRAAMETALTGQAWYIAGSCQVEPSGLVGGIGSIRAITPGMVVVSIPYNSAYNVTTLSMIVHDIGTYWLTPGQREGRKGLAGAPVWHWSEGWPAVSFAYPAASWLPVVQTSGEGYADLEVPSAGVAVLEIDGQKELVRWDRLLTPSAPLDYIRLLHIVERGVAGTPVLDLSGGAELKFVTGDDGTPAEVTLTLLESSGTATRGDYDTLGLGLGLGIPSSHIDEPSFTQLLELTESAVAIFSDGRTSLEELVGGWYALQGLCVVQRNGLPAGGVWDQPFQLAVVRTAPAMPTIDPDLVVTLTPSDVDLGGIGEPDTIESPTEVRVSRSGVDRDRPDVMPQDVPAIQALGLTTKEFAAPGMGERTAADAAMSRIVVGLGQGAVTIGVVPWLRPLLQLGASCKIALAHHAFYDWKTGTRRPAMIYATVVGWRFVLRTGRFYVTILKSGIAPETVFLARGEPVTGVYSTTTFGTATSANSTFAPSGATKAIVYNPGRESLGELAVLELSSDGAGSGGWSLSSGTLPAWVAAGTSWITMGELGTNDTAIEDAYMFYSAARRWGP